MAAAALEPLLRRLVPRCFPPDDAELILRNFLAGEEVKTSVVGQIVDLLLQGPAELAADEVAEILNALPERHYAITGFARGAGRGLAPGALRGLMEWQLERMRRGETGLDREDVGSWGEIGRIVAEQRLGGVEGEWPARLATAMESLVATGHPVTRCEAFAVLVRRTEGQWRGPSWVRMVAHAGAVDADGVAEWLRQGARPGERGVAATDLVPLLQHPEREVRAAASVVAARIPGARSR